jgi:DNA polymerase-3 subunit delta'
MTAEPERLRLRDRLIDQSETLARLSEARASGRLAQSYLLLGPRGCGKTRVALAFAQELLCVEPNPPCGLCAGCRKVAHLTHPDLHLVLPLPREEAEDPDAVGRILQVYAADPFDLTGTAKSASIGIDRIRALKEEAAKARIEGARRVVILSGADRMTEQAGQSALKLVEEPPPETILILEAEEATDLLPTLVSRCQRVRLKPLGRERLAELLQVRLEVPPAEANLLAALSGGSLGRALELRGDDVLGLRDLTAAAFDVGPGVALEAAEIERRVRRCERGWTAEKARRSAELLLLWLRDLAAARCGLEDGHLLNADRGEALREQGAALPLPEISRRLRIAEEMALAVEQNVNPALALSAAISRIASGGQEEDRFPRF